MVKYDIIKINNKNVKMFPKGITNMKFSQELDKAVARNKERIEREVPDTGYLRNFAEDSVIKKCWEGFPLKYLPIKLIKFFLYFFY